MAGPPIPPFAFVNHYQLVGHFLGAAGTQEWRSEFAIFASSIPNPTDPIILQARQYFISNLRSDCFLNELVLRQWTVGSQPIAARGSIWIDPVQVAGGKPSAYTGEQAAPAIAGKEVVAFIKQNTSPGKDGKQFLRQLYDLGDIGAVAGAPWELLPTARVTTARYNSVVNASVGTFFGAGKDPGFVVIHFSKKAWRANPVTANQPFSTPVLTLQIVGPSTNRPTRKNAR